MEHNKLSHIFAILKQLIFVYIIFLSIMSLVRVIFFNYYSPLDSIDSYLADIINAFILGFRIDLTVIGYIQVFPTLVLIILYYIDKKRFFDFFQKFLVYYLFLCFMCISFILGADFGFYSYFKEHINILFFGLLDDDTKALMITFWQNYDVVTIVSCVLIYLVGLFYCIQKIFSMNMKSQNMIVSFKVSVLLFITLFLLNFLIVRGTFGMYPLGKMVPNVSTNDFINKIAPNGFRSFTSALSARKKYLVRDYDLLKVTGYKHNIEKAFEVYTGTKDINRDNLLKNITFTTNKVDNKEYNVIVIMVESFGMPILKYQSKTFDILGELKKHFESDTLLTNMISAGNGTISSLQALLLNIPHRPGSFAFSQSEYKQTSFTYNPAFLYKDNGYETSFIYGGDLTWRNLGEFIKHQGYDNMEGKINIFTHLEDKTKDEDEYFHPWGIFDEHLYSHLLHKLGNSEKKQFIVALSTNNHPPYNIPNDYKSKSLIYTLKDNTIVVVTADNNTVDGIMKYDDNHLLNSKNIPLYFYLPKDLKEKLDIDTKVTGSHKDIFPTLYNLTLKDQEYIAIGKNLFDKNLEHYGFNGSRVVSSKKIVKKFDNFKQKDKMLEYYKASLAVSEFLIKYEYKKDKR